MSASLSGLATRLISDLGYWGLATGLVVDSMGAPIPSEVLVPLAVVAATAGRFQLWSVVVVAVAAQLIGAVLSFAVGRRWGLDVVARAGSYVLISPRHIERAQQVFARHGGWIAAGARCLPVVRGFIGYPAGAAGMDMGRYIGWSAAGTAAWTALLVVLGEVLSSHLGAIDAAFSKATTVIGVLLGAAILFAVWRAWRARRSARARDSE